MLLRSVSAEFYRENLIPLFILIYFCFGFLRSIEHISIAKQLLTGRIMWEYYIVWIVYISYTTHFTIQKIRNPAYQFLLNISLFSLYLKVSLLLALQLALLLPILAYGVFVAILATQVNSFINVLLVGLFFLFGIVISSTIISHKISSPYKGFIKRTTNNFVAKKTTPSWAFFCLYLLKEKGLILLVTKFLSTIFLIGFMYIFNVGTEDLRPLLISVLAAAAIHMNVIKEYFEFDTIQMQNFNQLPISIERKFFKHLLILFLILLPEVLILLRFAPSQYDIMMRALPFVLALSIAVAAFSRLYGVNSIDKYNNQLGIAMAVIFFAIMFNGGFLVMGLNFILAYFWFKNNYYSNQPTLAIEE